MHKDVTFKQNGLLDDNANVSLPEVIFNDSVDVRANSLKDLMAVKGIEDCVEASCGNDKDENARKLANGSSFLECGEASAGDLFCNSEMIKVDLEQFAGSNCTIVGGSQELVDDDKQGTSPETEHLKNGSAQNGVADVSEVLLLVHAFLLQLSINNYRYYSLNLFCMVFSVVLLFSKAKPGTWSGPRSSWKCDC